MGSTVDKTGIGAGSGALSGAAAGSVFGPIGTAIGAGVGALGGGALGYESSKDNQTPSVPTDPNLTAEQQQAQNELVASLQTQTQGDMASLMARYGTHLAFANTGISPLTG